MQLSTENYEFFAGRDDLVNEILDKVREEAMRKADDAEGAAIDK